MKIGISGSSGHVGSAVLKALVQRKSAHEPIAISRTAGNIAGTADRLGDYDRPDTLAAAYAGLDRLLIIPSADLRPGVRSAQALAAVDAAVAAGVGQVFLLSATGTRLKRDPDMGAAYWQAEQRLLRSAAAAWTILRMNYFAETFAQEARMALPAGVLTGLADNRVAFVSRDDVAAALAAALAGEGHAGAIYHLTGAVALSGHERAAAVQQATGQPMRFALASETQLRAGLSQAGLPPFLVDAVASIQAGQADGAYDIVSGDIERLTGRAPQPLADVLARELA